MTMKFQLVLFLIEKLPKGLTISNQFGEFHTEITKTTEGGNSISYVRKLTIYKNKVKPNQIEEWKRFWRKISKFDSKKVVLKRRL